MNKEVLIMMVVVAILLPMTFIAGVLLGRNETENIVREKIVTIEVPSENAEKCPTIKECPEENQRLVCRFSKIYREMYEDFIAYERNIDLINESGELLQISDRYNEKYCN